MSTRMVCDLCKKVIEPDDHRVVRGNGELAVANGGIYLEGSFRVSLDGRGEHADVCCPCVAKLLTVSGLEIRDGAKVRVAKETVA